MKRFLRNLVIVNGMVALGVGLGGGLAGWEASSFTLTLFLLCGVAFFLGSAALGGTGPAVHIGDITPGSGPNPMDAVLAGEETQSAYGSPGRSKGDFFPRWRARHGWNEGSRGVAFVLLATGVTLAIAGTISGLVFE